MSHRANWRASLRDTRLLLSEFRRPLLFFSITILGGGLGYFFLARSLGEPVNSPAEGIYLVLTMAFLAPGGPFPRHFILQLFYFILPLVGIGMLAQGLADFGILLFNRRARSKEWEMAVASTFSKHTILIGLGHLGYRVVKVLHEIEAQIVVIELDPKADLLTAVRAMNIPVIHDDGTRAETLEAAGVREARTIVLCTQDDALNLQMAVKARSLNPDIRVVIRIFDDEFARSLAQQFHFNALSATSMAAPAFAAAAADADITPPISVEGQALSLARLKVAPRCKLVGASLDQIQSTYELTVLLLRHDGETDMHPVGTRTTAPGDVLAVLGTPGAINALVHDSQ